jgi:hypothetical protein
MVQSPCVKQDAVREEQRSNAELDRQYADLRTSLLNRIQGANTELSSRFVDRPDDLVANVACEAMLRLSDPLLVPARWREL